MQDFNYYLEKIGEIGFVEEISHSLVYVSGIPEAHPDEVVIFETNDLGYVLSLNRDHVEILLLSDSQIKVGNKVTRTGGNLTVPVGASFLGRLVNALGSPEDGRGVLKDVSMRSVDDLPPRLLQRKSVDTSLETGVTIVDLIVPLGKGQRQLVIGDRKTGKTDFLMQTIVTQAKQGTVCIYAQIGQKKADVVKLYKYFEEQSVLNSVVMVASNSSDPSGLIFLTPYTAMTIAEGFRDQGRDVLIILDDMTTHARTYREISLLARRFPGRSSYPGDIFYIHAKLVERAGNFKKGSITCLPVAESLLGDLTGYIQTNLMAMTDGHIFFDIDLYNQGKRPAINPFLSVTRVGHQAQTDLLKDLSRELISFLVNYEKMKQFIHFGAEVGENAKKILALGGTVDIFLNQRSNITIGINVNIFILAGVWAGIWGETKSEDLNMEFEKIVLAYNTDDNYRKQIDEIIKSALNFSDLVTKVKRSTEMITAKLARSL